MIVNQIGVVKMQYNTYNAAITVAAHKSDFELTTGAPYFALTGNMTSMIHVWQRRSWLLPSTSDQPL